MFISRFRYVFDCLSQKKRTIIRQRLLPFINYNEYFFIKTTNSNFIYEIHAERTGRINWTRNIWDILDYAKRGGKFKIEETIKQKCNNRISLCQMAWLAYAIEYPHFEYVYIYFILSCTAFSTKLKILLKYCWQMLEMILIVVCFVSVGRHCFRHHSMITKKIRWNMLALNVCNLYTEQYMYALHIVNCELYTLKWHSSF